jgi:hypothetical protein
VDCVAIVHSESDTVIAVDFWAASRATIIGTNVKSAVGRNDTPAQGLVDTAERPTTFFTLAVKAIDTCIADDTLP